MKRNFYLFILLLFSYSVRCQSELIDLNGVFTGKYTMETLHFFNWRPSDFQFSYVKSQSSDTLFIQDAKNGQIRPLLTSSELASLFKGENQSFFPYYEWTDHNRLYFPSLYGTLDISQTPYTIETYPLNGKTVIAENVSNKLFIVKEKDGNVFVMSHLNNFDKILLCPDTGQHIIFGEAVHRSEWGIDEGAYISPKANFIAFYRMDESMVDDYPLVKTSTPIATLDMIKYPMAGRKSHEVKVGIFDVTASVEQQKTVFHYINTDIADGEFLTNITFSPDEKYLYITHVNRAQNHAKLIEYDVVSGNKTRVLIEERDERYVEPQTRMIFLKNNQFLWRSDRDGWKHYYLYDLSGRMIRQITKGNWDVIKAIGVDPREESFYFTTNKDSPTGRFTYQINMKNGRLKNLTPEDGTHSSFFSDNYDYFIDQFSNINTPNKIMLGQTSQNKTELLLHARNPYDHTTLGTTSLFPIKNKNGDDLYCRMIYPPGFDSTKKYPCLIYVYGGPHSQLVTNTFFSGGVFLQYLAQKGYIIFTLDNRGTGHRGAEFEKCIHRQLGTLEMEDQMTGVKYLTSKPFIDASRIGLDGWSYGGFMTLSLVTHHPEVFRSASCGGPVVDWKWYEIMYGERYMDTPEENPGGYQKSSILPKVKDIQCELLVMHGALDNVVVWQHSLELLNQAVKNQIQLDYFVYPSHEHNVRGKERVHLWNKIEKFHDAHLKNLQNN